MTGMFYMDDVDFVTIPQTKDGMIDILRIIGGKETVVCTVPDDNASVVGEIMGREEVNASVTVDGPLGIRVGDYVRVDGTVYTLNREAGMEKRSDVEYQYDLVFESPLYRLLDKLFTNPVTGVSTFTVSRTLKEFVKIVVDCVNTIDPGWTVSPGIPDTDPVNLTFEGISCREVLTRLSDGFGMEFYLSGREVRFVRDMENATGLVFEQGKGKGLYTVTQEPVDTGDIVTRVYPYGGTTNVFPADGDVNGRLRLPEGYLEDLTGYGKVVEREVVFDDIFPCLKAAVSSVSGEYNRVITCGDIDFDINSYGIAGVTAKINFLSGDLMGESFAFTYTHASKRIDLIRKEDRMAEPDNEGKRPLIPHDLKKVRAGDRFNLTDIYVPEEYKEKAIVELRARATDYLAYYSRPRVKFTLEVDHRFLRGRGVLRAGDTVTVKIPETGMEKPLRVNSVERNLGTGKMSCVVSNYLDERWEKRIEGEIASVRSSVSGDISDIRGEVSNVSRPSSLWYPDKLKEYLRLSEDGTVTILENGLGVKGNIVSDGDQIAFGSTTGITEVFAIADINNYGLVKYDGVTIKRNADNQLYADIDTGGIDDILPSMGMGNVITSLGLTDGGRKIQPYMGLTAWHSGNDGSGSGLDADLLDGHHWSEIAGLNVATATKLLYARTINGTSFDGTANIVTNTWGAERPFSIADHDFTNEGVAIKINGFSSYVLPLPSTIKATLLGNASSSTVATRLQTARTIFGQYFDGSGNVSGAMSGVTRINDMIHLDVAGAVGIGDKSGSWARFTGNRLDGMTVGGVMSDLYLNYTSPAKNARVDKDGNLITSGNVISNGDQIAFGSAGDITEVFAIASPTNYGLVKIDGSTIKIGADGRLYSGGGGGFGDIAFSGDGAFLSDVTPSADKRTLTFARVGKPTYTASEVGAIAFNGNINANAKPYREMGYGYIADGWPTTGPSFCFGADRLYNKQVIGPYGDNRLLLRSVINGIFTSWREFAFLDSNVASATNADMIDGYHVNQLMWRDGRDYGNIFPNDVLTSRYGFGYSTDGWPATGSFIAFGGFTDQYVTQLQASYTDPSYVYIRTRNDDSAKSWGPWRQILTCDSNNKLTSSGNLKIGMISLYGNNEINCDTDLYIGYRGASNIITNVGGGYLETMGRIYARDGITSYSKNPSMSWDSWQNYQRPFMVPEVTVALGAYYPVIGWSSVMPNGYRQYASIGSLRNSGFGDVTITVGRSDNNSVSARYFFSNDGSFTSDRIYSQGYIYCYTGWFENKASNTGLYNSTHDARWYADADGWKSDKSIRAYNNIIADGGYLFSVSNGQTIQIGSQNSSYCHYSTTAPAHWFNKQIQVSGGLYPYGGAQQLGSYSDPWGEVYCTSWFRSKGVSGWFSQDYEGGIYMNEAGWVKAYNKPFMCPSSRGSGCAGFGVNLVIGGTSAGSCGAEWECSDNIFGIGLHENDHVYFWGSVTADHYSSTGKTYCGDINLVNKQFSWYGLLLTNDDQVAFSDMRLKTKVDDYAIDIRDFVDAPLFTYYKKGSEKDGLRVGTEAQWMLDHMRLCVYGSEKDYYSYSYARGGFILGVSIIKRLVPWMDEKDKKIEELERRIHILESRQAS